MNLRMNLMPWRERRRASALRRFQLSLVATLVLALACMVVLDQWARERLARQSTLTAGYQAQSQALGDVPEATQRLRREHAEVFAQLQQLSRLRTEQRVLWQLLSGVERAMPGGARLSEISVKDDRLRIAGLAASASSVAQLMRDLEALGVARDLELVFLRRQASGDEFLLLARLPVDWS
jgi:type IV pilus assembly protein PilN